MPNSGELRNAVVLITGASGGIGAELARQFAREGSHVALAARSATKLDAVARECRSFGVQALAVPGDVSIQSDCETIVERTVATFGKLDVLVNNAGIGSSARFEDITDLTIFDRLMRVNYLGSVWCTAYALPHLKARNGRIVAVSSLTGLTGVPRRTAYSATKHAMAGFFDSLRIELADSGVSVTVIYPGFVVSDINSNALSADGTPYGERAYAHRQEETMDTDECCRAIVEATKLRSREVVMTWRGKVGKVVKALFPAVIDNMAKRVIEARK